MLPPGGGETACEDCKEKDECSDVLVGSYTSCHYLLASSLVLVLCLSFILRDKGQEKWESKPFSWCNLPYCKRFAFIFLYFYQDEYLYTQAYLCHINDYNLWTLSLIKNP